MLLLCFASPFHFPSSKDSKPCCGFVGMSMRVDCRYVEVTMYVLSTIVDKIKYYLRFSSVRLGSCSSAIHHRLSST